METNLLLRPLRPVGTNGPVTPPTVSIANLSTKRQTCLQCRIRKVQCDGQPTTCGNCQRLEFDCSFRQTTVGSASMLSSTRHGATAGLQLPGRRRRTQACVHCHTRKMKGLVCTYPASSASKRRQQMTDATSSESPDSSRHSWASLSPAAAAAATAQQDRGTEGAAHRGGKDVLDPTITSASFPLTAAAPDPITLNKLHLSPLPSYAFLHKPTVQQRCQDATLDAPLKLALCAITALLLQRPAHCHDLWAQQAEHQLLHGPAALFRRPSVARLQALLLLMRYRTESGDFAAAFMLASLAARGTRRARAAAQGSPERTGPAGAAADVEAKLSVQSLLLQSDFVDDSDEIALSNPGSPFDQITTTTTSAAAAIQSANTFEVPIVTTTSVPNPPPPQQPPSGFGADPTDFLAIKNDGNSFDSGLSQGSGSDITDDDFVFNPWMGFPEGGNLYIGMGMSWNIDQEDY
ncbi:hypothetical protein PG994_007171 [Apiospora phragmitis]|uniref:Zn(2)-C6 fungal-type domain-containing protein n=1 Tax=Apiospora phragmitis TaxID=2905665 RepID=A0ABR1V3D5_9PEZI